MTMYRKVRHASPNSNEFATESWAVLIYFRAHHFLAPNSQILVVKITNTLLSMTQYFAYFAIVILAMYGTTMK